MKNLWAKVAEAVEADTNPVGFRLATPVSRSIADEATFRTELIAQDRAIEYRPINDILRDIELDGTVGKTGLRLSQQAFGDFAAAVQAPVTFIQRLTAISETDGRNVVELLAESAFRNGPPKLAVVDTRTNLIEGIVGEATYSPLRNIVAYDAAKSGEGSKLTLGNAWLNGTAIRFNLIARQLPVDVQRGDIIFGGVSIENSLTGDVSAKVVDYIERLVCTNGLRRPINTGGTRIEHRGEEIEYHFSRAILASHGRSTNLTPLLQASARHYLTDRGVRTVHEYIASPEHSGGQRAALKALEHAQHEAKTEGRSENELTVWNFVNGVTEQTHTTRTLQRRAQLETLGLSLLERFTDRKLVRSLS